MFIYCSYLVICLANENVSAYLVNVIESYLGCKGWCSSFTLIRGMHSTIAGENGKVTDVSKR